MKKFSFLVGLAFMLYCFTFTSCDSDLACTQGEVRMTNHSRNPYDVYVDGVFYVTVPGESFVELDFDSGEYKFRARQRSGFLLFPTIVNDEVSVFGCQETQFVFP